MEIGRGEQPADHRHGILRAVAAPEILPSGPLATTIRIAN
jgi:hypothetical protein